ncbi:MAG: protein kinase domain-containing protein [Syntrophobacteraceae bacterium]
MPDHSVLLINLIPEEIRHIEELLSHFDLGIGSTVVPAIGDAEAYSNQGDLILVILGVRVDQKRPDQDVHFVRRLIGRSVPLLVLVSPDQATKAREYLRAGADEYWILPLDSTAFPPRLEVLLEWGQSAFSEEFRRRQEVSMSKPRRASTFYRVYYAFRDFFTPAASKKTMQSELLPLIANKWKKIRRLGFGTKAEIWLVQEERGDKLSVAKVPHSRQMNTTFLRVAAILRRMAGHPNAVQLKEVVKDEGRVVLIQEYVEGHTVRDLLDQGMDSITKEKVFLELVEVVAHAHERNIIHRDIKPENVIITPAGVSKLLDFGAGKDLSRWNTSGTAIGTRPFMAPEQIMGDSRLASDVWSLGVMLYLFATGSLPFHDDNQKVLMDLILECDPGSPRNLEPELPLQLESIILKCLQKDQSQRYRNAAILRSELLRVFPGFGQGKVLPQS